MFLESAPLNLLNKCERYNQPGMRPIYNNWEVHLALLFFNGVETYYNPGGSS